MVDVNLAGYNIPVFILDEMKDFIKTDFSSNQNRQEFKKELIKIIDSTTPEPISASYARISRSKKSIKELRKEAIKELEKARKSNESIIFGMGHSTIAEHAYFNIDIKNISRYLVEFVQRHRLDSFTEKSQRYVRFNKSFYLPKEINSDQNKSTYKKQLKRMFKFYDNLINEDIPEQDARYILPLATHTQLGLSLNARNLEYMIIEARSSSNEEMKELGDKLAKEVSGIADSVVKYLEPTDFYSKTSKNLKAYTRFVMENHEINSQKNKDLVTLHNNLDEDSTIIAGIIFRNSDLNFKSSLDLTGKLKQNEKKEFIKIANKYRKKYNSTIREYELGNFKKIGEFLFSAAGFGQFKRLRMDTILPQEYDIKLGVTIPESIKESRLRSKFEDITNEVNQYYNNLKSNFNQDVATYALANANMRRVLFAANFRQNERVSSERLDHHAQWEIRNKWKKYISLIKKHAPLSAQIWVGKDKHQNNLDYMMNEWDKND